MVLLRCLPLLCLLFSLPSFSAPAWVGPFTVSDVSQYAYEGYATLTATIKEKEKITVNCSLAKSAGRVSNWAGDWGAVTQWHSAWLSILLAAEAQGKQVMLLLDSSRCSTWAGGYFVGVKLVGE